MTHDDRPVNAPAVSRGAADGISRDVLPERLTYTLGEAAHALGISERLLRTLVQEGEIAALRPLRLGRRVLLSRAAVEGLVDELREADVARLRPWRRRGARP